MNRAADLPGRLDRQLLIPEWNQNLLGRARVGVVGDDPLFLSLYLLAAAALGLNQVRVVAPRLDDRLIALAQALNPEWQLSHFEGHLTHPHCLEVFRPCQVLVNLGSFALADKILLEEAFQHQLPVIRGYGWQDEHDQGFQIFTYVKGREWLELREVMPPVHLPEPREPLDGVLDIIAAGLILEETKNILLGLPASPDVIRYRRPRLPQPARPPAIGIVGAGALGNFVGLGLALAGVQEMTVIDPDVIEVTNLNRQVLFAGAVGAGKAETLAARLNRLFGIRAAGMAEYFQAGGDLSGFEVIFDCVDNFATRIALSEAGAAAEAILISGGAAISQGQVVAYHPQRQPQTPAQVLGLPELVAGRAPEPLLRSRAACVYQPDPAVIMTNQIIGGFMVEAYRCLLAGAPWPPLFYDAGAAQRFRASH